MTPIDQIQKAFESGKISGSWLIVGGYEYEKKNFISNACSIILNQNINMDFSFHPNIKWIECGLTEEAKKEIQKNILAGKGVETEVEYERKREITVDDVRSGIQFLSLKSDSTQSRILIIYPADKMNENAANALLKVLEEPPQNSVLFLLCQNLGKLLPTIKSRCRQIAIKPLSAKDLMYQIQRKYPMIEDIDLVVSLARGSLGLAMEICENDGLALYHEMLSLLKLQQEIPLESLKEFSDKLGKDENAFNLFKKFMLDWLCEQTKKYALVSPFIAEDYMDLYQEVHKLFSDIDRIYLDKKQVIQTIFFKVGELIND